MAEAGWYAAGDGIERWFDGDSWTNKVRRVSNAPLPPLPSASAPPTPPPPLNSKNSASKVDYSPKMDSAGTSVTQPQTKGVWWGCLGCLALIAVPVIAFAIYSATRDKSGDADELREVQAQRACEDQVREQLKSPSSASFSNITATGSGASWDVYGSVDAENAFGATIRSDFSCDVRFTGNTVGVIVSGLQ